MKNPLNSQTLGTGIRIRLKRPISVFDLWEMCLLV